MCTVRKIRANRPIKKYANFVYVACVKNYHLSLNSYFWVCILIHKINNLPCYTFFQTLTDMNLKECFLSYNCRAFSNKPHLFQQSKNVDREKQCSPVSNPQLPRLSLALPHVVTLIIVFFHMFHTYQAKLHLLSVQPGKLEHKSIKWCLCHSHLGHFFSLATAYFTKLL